MENGYSERIVRMRKLKARGESRDSLERENTRTSENKFFKHNYPAFQNVRNIFKGCVIYIFASLLFMSEREHL